MSGESLERRQLLAGDIALAHNYLIAQDVDQNRTITAGDALAVINYLNAYGSGEEITETSEISAMVDVNGDHRVTANDALAVINALNLGEGAGELVELVLTPRKPDDTLLDQGSGSRDFQVTVGEVFYLELAYSDFRTFGNDLGAFQISTDISLSQSGVLIPLVTETQTLRFSGNVRSATSGEFVFSLPGEPGSYTSSLSAFSEDTIGEISNALVELGYTTDQFRITNQSSAVTEQNPQPDLIFQIRFIDLDLAGDDLPNLTVTNNLDVPVTVTTTTISPVTSTGEVNGVALPSTFDLRSRTFTTRSGQENAEFYTERQFGTFDPDATADAFNEVGAIGKANPQGVRGETIDGRIIEPFDAFSIPVMFVQPVSNLQVSLNPAEDDEAILLYPGGEGTKLTQDQVLIDEDGVFTITAVAASTGVTANDGTLTVAEDATTAVTIDLANLVTVTSGGAATVAITTNGTRGNATLNGTVLSYVPSPNEFGADTIVYTATNDVGSDTGTINVTVTPVNDAPTAGTDTATTSEETTLNINASTLLANDSAGPANENQTLTLTAVTNGTGGTVSLNNNVVTFTPAAGFAGPASFTYTVSDGTATAQGTVNVNVTGVNDPPTAGADTLTTNRNQTLSIPVTTLLANDSAGPANENQTLTVTAVTSGTGGTATLSGNTVTFTPTTDFLGAATFTYTVSDGTASTQGNVTVNVSEGPPPPVATNDTLTAAEDTPLTITAAQLLGNDTPTGATITQINVGNTATGTLVNNNNGTFTYTPPANVFGNNADDFTYTITANNQTSTATVTINITAVNDPPTGGPVSVSAQEDTAITFTPAQLLASVNPGPNEATQTLSITGVSAGSTTSGTVVRLADGSVRYTPAANFNGVDSFTMTVSDNGSPARTASITVNVNVAAANDPPVANLDSIVAFTNAPRTIAASELLGNDSAGPANESTQVLTITAVSPITGTTRGTVVRNANGSVTFTPEADFVGTTSFNYTISDGTATAVGTVNVTVQDFNPSVITGSVFFDHVENLDQIISSGATPIRNGVQDADESGLGGVPVRLVSAANENATGQAVELTSFTELDGTYRFENVAPGTYRVVYDIPSNVIYGRDIAGTAGDDGTPDGEMTVVVAQPGGTTRSGLNFTLLGTQGTALDNIDILASTYLNSNSQVSTISNGGVEGGLVALSSNGDQEFFRAGEGFDDVRYAELTLNEARDAALLTIVEEDGSIKTTRLSSDQFVVSRDGRAAHFFGAQDDFNFVDAGSDLIAAEFANYRNAIDRILGNA